MHVIRLRDPAALTSLEAVALPDPGAPGPGEILLRVRASSLNYHDYLVATGVIKTPAGRIPLSDGAGEVAAVGAGVSLTVGTPVVTTFFPNWRDGRPLEAGFADVPGDGADGYAREWAIVPETAVTPAPAGYSHAEAATLPCAGVTAWRALVVEGGLKAGDSVLVLGTGGVSIFALQFAKAMGATVIATSSSDAKLDRLRGLGADHLINYRTEPNWGAAVRALTGGRGVDQVVEVGGAGTLPQSITAARVGGHIALIGVLTGVTGPVSTAQLMAKQLRLVGITVGTRRQQIDMIAAIDANGIRPVIDRAFPLMALADAFRHQERGSHFGKIAIDI